jgi:hypothetical protein
MNTTENWAPSVGGLIGLLLIVGLALAFYLFACYCFKLICEKTGQQPGILVWIPIGQIIPLLQVAGMQEWMIILFFIPLENIVIGIMMWAKICTARGKSPWLVILMFIPFVNLIFIPYLAFSE